MASGISSAAAVATGLSLTLSLARGAGVSAEGGSVAENPHTLRGEWLAGNRKRGRLRNR